MKTLIHLSLKLAFPPLKLVQIIAELKKPVKFQKYYNKKFKKLKLAQIQQSF